ncbi:hypothetical protein [Haliangium ochraceum]|nr:hypothetical protein [Haliangium ochraceum]
MHQGYGSRGHDPWAMGMNHLDYFPPETRVCEQRLASGLHMR